MRFIAVLEKGGKLPCNKKEPNILEKIFVFCPRTRDEMSEEGKKNETVPELDVMFVVMSRQA